MPAPIWVRAEGGNGSGTSAKPLLLLPRGKLGWNRAYPVHSLPFSRELN